MKKEENKRFLLFLIPILTILLSCNNNFLLSDGEQKALGATVTQPIVMGIPAPNSIAVYNVSFADNTGSQIAEYAISLTNDALPENLVWQTSTVFNGLYPATTYFVFARSAENASHQAGRFSVSDPIRFYNVSFHANGAMSGSAPGIQTVLENGRIMLPGKGDLGKNNFAFGAWNTRSDGNGVNFTPGQLYEVTGGRILFARWVPGQIHVFRFVPSAHNAQVVSGITISQTAAGGHQTTGILEIANPSYFTLIEWFYGSIKLGEGSSLTLDAADIRYNLIGTHNVTVIAWQGGVPFSLQISFMVVL